MAKTEDKEGCKKLIRETFTYDSGYGTKYERYSMKNYLSLLVERYQIENVLEAYCDGITGIPGIAGTSLAMKGCLVTLGNISREVLGVTKKLWKRAGLLDHVEFVEADLCCLPFDDSTFDLVWNFAVIPHISDPRIEIKEMKRVSRRFVLIFCPNRWNYGFLIHRLHHKVTKTPWDHGHPMWMGEGTLEKIFEQHNLSVVEKGCIDVPPWPDLDITILPETKIRIQKEVPDFLWDDNSKVMIDMARYSIIEKSSLPRHLKLIFAHHVYILAEKIYKRT